MITLFWCPHTRASRIAWLLEESGLPYEIAQVSIGDDAARAGNPPAFAAASPMGKVPAIQDGPVALADSAAIGLYVADRYPQSGLAPAIDAADRGRYLYWMTFTPGVMEPAMGEKLSGAEPNHVTHGWGSFDSMIRTLEGGLEPGPWLLGERFSAADVLVGSTACYMRLFNMLPDIPALQAYADRCEARPAYHRAQALEPAAEQGGG